MKSRRLSAAFMFHLVEAVYWTVMPTYCSYVVAFGLERGYRQSQVSLMMAAFMLGAFCGQFFWGGVCDKLQTNKRVFLFAVASAGCVQLIMYFVVHPVAFGILYGVFGFLLGPMGSILDTWLLRSIRYDMKVYGTARGTGSASYAVMMLAMGMLIQRFGFHLMPWCSTAMVVLTLLLAAAMPDAPLAGEASEGGVSFGDIFSIIKIPAYVMIVLVMFFIGAAGSPVSSLKIMVLQSVGGNVGTQGLDSFCGSAVQFFVFLLAGVLARIPARARLWIGALCVCGAMAVDFAAWHYGLIILGTVLTSASYGFLIPAARQLVVHIVSPQFQTTAHGLVDAFYSFLAGVISLFYAGALAENLGVKFMIFVSLLLAAVPLLILAGESIYRGCRGKRV